MKAGVFNSTCFFIAMPEEHYLNITQQAKYSTIGNLNSTTKQVWFVLHGYGQLSRFFIKKFSLLADIDHFIIAPEATSRFYLNGHNERVGATWMTKEDRLKDIENYVSYLNSLYDSFDFLADIQITVVGFSQGAATASRWLANGHARAHRLLLWAGIFPPDMDILYARKTLKDTEVYNVYGTEDPFLDQEKLSEQKKIVEQLQLSTKNISFEGKHDIDNTTLLSFS